MKIERGSAPRCYEVCIISSMLLNTSSQSKVSNSAYFITLSSLCNYKTIKGHEKPVNQILLIFSHSTFYFSPPTSFFSEVVYLLTPCTYSFSSMLQSITSVDAM